MTQYHVETNPITKKTEIRQIPEPLFKNKETMSKEQLTDPDYRLKMLQDQYNGLNPITCSKCHHCR